MKGEELGCRFISGLGLQDCGSIVSVGREEEESTAMEPSREVIKNGPNCVTGGLTRGTKTRTREVR